MSFPSKLDFQDLTQTLAELTHEGSLPGMRLLQKMGWRRGKGVGKLDHEDEADEDVEGGHSVEVCGGWEGQSAPPTTSALSTKRVIRALH